MFVNGIFADFQGTIYKIGEPVSLNNTKGVSVIVAVSQGYNQDRKNLYIECSFWGRDCESIQKYPAGHLISVKGELICEAYQKQDGNLGVRYKVRSVLCWQSLQSLPQISTNTNANQPENQKRIKENVRSSVGTDKDKLRQYFNIELNFGPYKGKTLNAVLKEDMQYVYDLVISDTTPQKWKQILTVCYNFYYNKQAEAIRTKESKEKKKDNLITVNNGAGRKAKVPYDYSNVSDEDLPF